MKTIQEIKDEVSMEHCGLKWSEMFLRSDKHVIADYQVVVLERYGFSILNSQNEKWMEVMKDFFKLVGI